MLLPKEIVFKDRMDANSRHELLLYSAMRQFIGTVERVSCCDLDRFLGLPKPEQLVKERDVALKRDVVVVKKSPRLCFRHVFKGVPRGGTYVAGLRMRLSHAKWDQSPSVAGLAASNPPATFSVRRVLAGGKREKIVEQSLNANWWSWIEFNQVRSKID